MDSTLDDVDDDDILLCMLIWCHKEKIRAGLCCLSYVS